MNIRISLCVPLFIFFGCKHEKETITPVSTPVITPVKIPKVAITNLKYATDTLKVVSGNNASVTATFTGKDKGGKVFTLKSTKDLSGFSVDTMGTISLANTIADGIYPISVEAKNNDTTTVFTNVLIVSVSKDVIAPSKLSYGTVKISSYVGGIVKSATPTVAGSAPFTYTLSSTSSAFKIDANTGVFTSDNSLKEGTYIVEVTVKNSKGELKESITVEISKPISFDTSIKPILVVCTNCHPNGDTDNYGEFSGTKNNINEVIRRVSLAATETGAMPKSKSTPRLTESQINLIKQWQAEGLNP